MKVSIKKQLSNTEKNDVLDLLAKSFPFNYYKNYKLFKDNINFVPYSNYILLKKNNQLAAVLVLLDRLLSYETISLSVCGMSSMAIAKNFQNLETSKILKENLFEYCNNFELSIGFARKVMDYYWMPHGFLGISNYGEFHIKTNEIKTYGKENIIKSKVLETNDLSKVNKIYSKMHSSIVGNFLRDEFLWSFYIKKIKNNNQNIIKFLVKDKIIGYFLHSDSKVLELAYLKDYEKYVSRYIKEYFTNLKIDKINFHLNFDHPFIKYLSRFPFSKFEKNSPQGGHILRINNFSNFISKIKPLLEKKINNYNMKCFKIYHEGLIFEYKNNVLDINFENDLIFDNKQKLKLTHLFFRLSDHENDIIKLLFPKTKILFPELDHF